MFILLSTHNTTNNSGNAKEDAMVRFLFLPLGLVVIGCIVFVLNDATSIFVGSFLVCHLDGANEFKMTKNET